MQSSCLAYPCKPNVHRLESKVTVLPPEPATIDTGPLAALEQPALSVVIPVKNGAATIADQLVALATQIDAPRFEIIVSANGSTDSTRTVVRSVAAACPLP